MSCGSWMAAPSPLKLSPPSPLQRNKNGVSSSFLCCGHRSDQKSRAADLALSILHDSLEASGIDTKHARAAREGFCEQIGRLTEINGDTSIAISKGPDLARTALFIAAEDDSLVSHSSVPLPVEAFIERLDDLSMGFCPLYMPPSHSPPEVFLANLERYFYVHKGFHRPNVMSDSRALYLHSVLTCRLGSAVMLSLIYSEMLKMLRICGFLDFDVEIYFPHDLLSLPRGYHKQKSKLSDQPHIMTAKSLLVEILRDLKDAFWPFQYNKSNSLFLRAAYAANHVRGPSFASESYSEPCSNVSGLEIASAKAAQHRIGRGVWTSVRFGDMRRALAACERLILLAADYHDLRDYAVLLYHCGHYEECLHYLKLYKSSKSQGMHIKRSQTSMDEEIEEDAVEKMMARVILILGEEGWGKQTVSNSYWGDNSEPW